MTFHASHERRKAILLLVSAAVLWSSSGLFVKLLSWGPFAILSARSLIATVVILAYLRRPASRWTQVQVVGALAYVGSQLFFIIATKLTTAANAIFLTYTSPLHLIPLSYWFLDERPKRADWIAMLAIFTGMLFFFGSDLSLDGFRGNVFGALGGLSMAVMILCMRRQKTGTPANTILLGNLMGAAIGLPWLLQATATPTDLTIIGYLGVFQIGLSFVCYSIAIKSLPAMESTLILTIEPILNPLWVFLLLGEVPGQMAMIGGLLVLGAVAGRAVTSAYAVPEESLQEQPA